MKLQKAVIDTPIGPLRLVARDGVLCAVLDRHVDFLAQREGELREIAAAMPDDDIESVVEAIVRPAAELAESGWRGRCFLLILAELIEERAARPGVVVDVALNFLR